MSVLTAHQGLRGLTLAVISEWTTILTLIFGGCCSNALTLEQLTRAHPQSGSLITFAQFILVSVHGLPKFLTFSRGSAISWFSIPIPRLRERKIPLTRYSVQVALFYAVSLLNNRAFGYRIPMPVHIIFRSGGLVVSMTMGWLFAGKRYKNTQVAAVLLVTGGVILTTLSASAPKARVSSASASQSTTASTSQYATGIALLSLALVLAGALGLAQDRSFAKYTRPTAETRSENGAANRHVQHGAVPAEGDGGTIANVNGNERVASQHRSAAMSIHGTKQDDEVQPWQESMFYLHFLSLPMFYFVREDLLAQVDALSTSPPLPLTLPALTFSASLTPIMHPPFGLEKPLSLVRSRWLDFSLDLVGAIPSGYAALALTTLTSLVCVAGVNRLTARVSSLTVTLVLVVRKAVSMVVSVALFGTRSGTEIDTRMMWAGAALVFLGTMGYAGGSRSPKTKTQGEEGKVKKD